ncbi:MAG TPA: sigma-54 dependent transcriptional regulator [Candidatus Dormibacteraeota bacterium]|nr:sigma-54 dependent transcriptional regulator [Candidatus Dormibacteraeota bacterium]
MPATILLFETSSTVSSALLELFRRQDIAVLSATDKSRLLQLSFSRGVDFIVLGPSLADPYLLADFVADIREHGVRLPLMLLVANGSEELAVSALRSGVHEYVKASSLQELAHIAVGHLSRNHRLRDLNSHLANGTEVQSELIGSSMPMQDIKARLARIAAKDSSVLITGETGTGKELVAGYIHRNSPRRHRPFIAINCAAIPDSLLESELFGFEKGSFTGAAQSRQGKLKAADGGTVFLDEIGDMTPYAQAKLLRVAEAKEIQRLGTSSSVPIDVRIVAATNQDLEHLVETGKFRKDLFFRLNVASVRLPPLRERRQDILELIQHFLLYFNNLYGCNFTRISDEAVHYCLAHDFPGNVRELRNLIESIFVELPSEEIQAGELPAPIRPRSGDLPVKLAYERERLLGALVACNWNKSKAAQKLEWSRMTLYRKMLRYKITGPSSICLNLDDQVGYLPPKTRTGTG